MAKRIIDLTKAEKWERVAKHPPLEPFRINIPAPVKLWWMTSKRLITARATMAKQMMK